MVLDSINEYDVETADKINRGDFLSYLLQQRDKLEGEMNHRDMVNHLMNNL
jgi:hypothetical protein